MSRASEAHVQDLMVMVGDNMQLHALGRLQYYGLFSFLNALDLVPPDPNPPSRTRWSGLKMAKKATL